MFPSLGYYKELKCPFFFNGSCNRPYCHFQHVKEFETQSWEDIIDSYEGADSSVCETDCSTLTTSNGDYVALSASNLGLRETKSTDLCGDSSELYTFNSETSTHSNKISNSLSNQYSRSSNLNKNYSSNDNKSSDLINITKSDLILTRDAGTDIDKCPSIGSESNLSPVKSEVDSFTPSEAVKTKVSNYVTLQSANNTTVKNIIQKLSPKSKLSESFSSFEVDENKSKKRRESFASDGSTHKRQRSNNHNESSQIELNDAENSNSSESFQICESETLNIDSDSNEVIEKKSLHKNADDFFHENEDLSKDDGNCSESEDETVFRKHKKEDNSKKRVSRHDKHSHSIKAGSSLNDKKHHSKDKSKISHSKYNSVIKLKVSNVFVHSSENPDFFVKSNIHSSESPLQSPTSSHSKSHSKESSSSHSKSHSKEYSSSHSKSHSKGSNSSHSKSRSKSSDASHSKSHSKDSNSSHPKKPSKDLSSSHSKSHSKDSSSSDSKSHSKHSNSSHSKSHSKDSSSSHSKTHSKPSSTLNSKSNSNVSNSIHSKSQSKSSKDAQSESYLIESSKEKKNISNNLTSHTFKNPDKKSSLSKIHSNKSGSTTVKHKIDHDQRKHGTTISSAVTINKGDALDSSNAYSSDLELLQDLQDDFFDNEFLPHDSDDEIQAINSEILQDSKSKDKIPHLQEESKVVSQTTKGNIIKGENEKGEQMPNYSHVQQNISTNPDNPSTSYSTLQEKGLSDDLSSFARQGKGRKRIAHVPNVSLILDAKNKVRSTAQIQALQKHLIKSSPTPSPSTSSSVSSASEKKFLPSLKFPCDKGIASVAKRNMYLNYLYNEFKKNVQPQEAKTLAEDSEYEAFSSSKTQNMYSCRIASCVKKARQFGGETSFTNTSANVISHAAVLAGKSGINVSNIYQERRFVSNDKGKFYSILCKYVLDEEQLKTNGYPLPHATEKGVAVVQPYRKRVMSSKPFEKICCRCGSRYSIDKHGRQINKEQCSYHYGHIIKMKLQGSLESRYWCCKLEHDSVGCSSASCHVFEDYDPNYLPGFVETFSKDKVPDDGNYGVYALDCEMIYTTGGLELARVTVINPLLQTIYETLVKPGNEVLDYNTRFSGIKEEDMIGVTTTIADVQAYFLNTFSDKTILIGHSLDSDLKALKIIHKCVVDTSVIFPHRLGPPFKRSLKNLAQDILKKVIQEDVSGHDSAEDAVTAMELVRWRVAEDTRFTLSS